MATLTGTVYRLTGQTIVDGAIVDETEVPVSDGRIAIPELGIDEPLEPDGTFSLSNLPVSADPDAPTEVTVIFTAPGLGSYTYLNLPLYPGRAAWILTPQMTDTPRVNDRSSRYSDGSATLPKAGTVGRSGRLNALAAVGLLVLFGFACTSAAVLYGPRER